MIVIITITIIIIIVMLLISLSLMVVCYTLHIPMLTKRQFLILQYNKGANRNQKIKIVYGSAVWLSVHK